MRRQLTAVFICFVMIFTQLFFAPRARAAAIFYIDYASGSNSNVGSKASPWKSHPYMQNCGTSFPSYSHTPGDQFIFKGGVTWPANCFGIHISLGGSGSGTQDYYGVDLTWFTGGSFTRPVFDAANNSVTGGPFVTVRSQWITFDNLEMKRLKVVSPANGNCVAGNMDLGAGTKNILVKNSFIHDWTIAAITDGSTSHETGSICQNGASGPINVDSVEMSDAATTAVVPFGACFRNLAEIKNSKCHDTGEGEVGHFGPIHDNEFYNINGVAVQGHDHVNHTNVIEASLTSVGDAPIYNNLIHDNNAGVTIFDCNQANIYNNVLWHNSNSQIMLTNACPGATSSTVANIVNNTVYCPTGGCFRFFYRPTGVASTLILRNNHWITNSAAPACFNNVGAGCSNIATGSQTTPNVTMSGSTATAQGYTIANQFAPTSSSNGTVNAGVNLSLICSVNAALCTGINGISRGIAWDSSAHEFSGSTPPVKLQPPTGLTAVVQ